MGTAAGRETVGTTGHVKIVAPARTEDLLTIRRTARRFVEALGADDDVADDLELVVSELTTNVIRHTDSTTITVVLRRTTTEWLLDVADAERLPPLDELPIPAPDDPTGRGLIVVQALVDRVELVDVDGRHVVRCVRAIPHRPGRRA